MSNPPHHSLLPALSIMSLVACNATVTVMDDDGGGGSTTTTSTTTEVANGSGAGNPGDDGDADGDGDGDAGDGEAGPGGGDPPDASELTDSGFIVLLQSHDEPARYASVSASFRTGEWVDERRCTEVSDGACVLRRCDGPYQDSPGQLDAGSVSIAGALLDVDLDRLPHGGYDWMGTGELFTAGATLTATGTGGTVPAFTAHLTAPPRIVALSPPFADLAVPVDEDLSIAFTVSGVSDVQLVLFANEGEVEEILACHAPSDAGSISVPARLVPTLGEYGYGYISTRLEARVAIGTHDVDLITMDIADEGTWFRSR